MENSRSIMRKLSNCANAYLSYRKLVNLLFCLLVFLLHVCSQSSHYLFSMLFIKYQEKDNV